MLAAQTELLLTTVSSLDVADLAQPSRCEGWTRAHVVSHLTANAAALVNVVRAAVDDVPVTMYPSDVERDAEIEREVGRTPQEHLATLRSGCEELAVQLARLGPEHTGRMVERTPGGRLVPAAAAAFLRLNEVVIHHTDLAAGHDFAAVAPEVAQLLVAHHISGLAHRAASVDLVVAVDGFDPVPVGAGGQVVGGAAGPVLGWLTRGRTDGVATLDGTPLPSLPPEG
ncbi:hypothetical protein VV01_08900 [Luteipulveratus halotolerans]|uniref:Mycothiol-dependent maleylpyruvate isomerase metal-binding domain-containing protein n=2 Tax=Luteipulveratus halotolerans TaxID=1631356 RepID=A0A0L6CNM4_9MICO|nr:hypothetical protein VV01_08900 [Luteipulveratus halotolerans]